MKKSLLALAVLGAFAGAASAQSSVTIFGIVDLNLRYVDNTGAGERKSMGTDGINSNRLGFRGVEDLGGGMRAGFHIEGAMSPDDGTAAGQQWRRRSTVSLMGNFGEVRLGRDYTPTFWNTTIFDPFGTNGVGSSLNVARAVGGAGGAGATSQATYVRSNNAVSYFLPAMGGLYGQVMVAPGEGATGAAGGAYEGGRIGYAAGPFNVALSLGQQEYSGSSKYKTKNVAGSFKFGVTTLMVQYNDDALDADAARVATPQELAEERWLFGASIVMGQGLINVSYVKSDWKNDNPTTVGVNESNSDATQLAIGYVYNLSPRTALYATYSKISNDGTSTFAVAGGGSSPGAVTAGGSSTGMEFGLRHSF